MRNRMIIRYNHLKTIFSIGLVGVSAILFISLINFGIQWAEVAGSFKL